MLTCAGCVSGGHPDRELAAGSAFDPTAFFAGRTQGTGVLKVAFRGPELTLVEGHGRVAADGTVILDQEVRRGARPATRRTWHLHLDGAGRYSGTLTDATGPVTGQVEGNRLHLSFAMKGGLHAQQWLDLQPGGTVARNVMVVSKFGMPLARLDETITRK
ncbi:DUF3833 family protein [Sphingomonas sp.]|uniref:DUF3833 family protein n=1 Tax=Sphingomonas sp. TaxID=28214 RepID=UPI0035BC2637